MIQARIHGPDDLRLDEVPEPVAGPGDVVLRVRSCGICGSDLGYIALGGLAGPGPEPMAIGHELAGVVASVGPGVETLSVGDRVALDPRDPDGGVIGNGRPEGGLAPLLLVHHADRGRLHKLPDAMPFEVAALAEPLGVGMNAVDKLRVAPHEKAVVFGAGPVGLAAVASLRDQGCEDVVAVDLSPGRLRLAERLGARATVNAGEGDVFQGLRGLHGEARFFGAAVPATDVFVEASGAPSVIQQVIGGAKRGARLAVVALHRKPIEVSFLLVLMRELQINGAMEYPEEFGRSLDVLARADLSPMITHRYPLERLAEAVEVARDASLAGKVMITMDSAAEGPDTTA
jgi:threonine dehydrogenase-like Zn-dependent dehydrogenase